MGSDLFQRGFLFLGSLLGNQLLGKGVIRLQTGAGRDQLADDDVLLQAYQMVGLALDGSLGQNLGGLLEGGGGQEGVGGRFLSSFKRAEY